MSLTWIPVTQEPLPKEGVYLVEIDRASRPIQVAYCTPTMMIVGNRFSFDLPPVIAWARFNEYTPEVS